MPVDIRNLPWSVNVDFISLRHACKDLAAQHEDIVYYVESMETLYMRFNDKHKNQNSFFSLATQASQGGKILYQQSQQTTILKVRSST